jgi:hypothetical protein
MYLIIKFVSKDIINLLLTANFVFLGVASIYKVFLGVSQWLSGNEFAGDYTLVLAKKGAGQ